MGRGANCNASTPCHGSSRDVMMECHSNEAAIEELKFYTNMTPQEDILNLINALSPRKIHVPLMRVGPNGDGGYLVPDDFNGIHALFSPGVGDISGFEKDCASMGLRVFMADLSVPRPAEEHAGFHFINKNVGCIDADTSVTLDTWVSESVSVDCDKDLILQMDIEGSEYESIISISQSLLLRFRIIVVEFHSLDQLWSAPFFRVASRAFEKLLQFHSCVHIHPNNCCGSLVVDDIVVPRVCEFTFLRNDRGVLPGFVEKLPHELDQDNTDQPTLPLDPKWLGLNQ